MALRRCGLRLCGDNLRGKLLFCNFVVDLAHRQASGPDGASQKSRVVAVLFTAIG